MGDRCQVQFRCRTLISICNQPATKANYSAFYPSGVGKWVPGSAGKAKASMVHSVSGCTRGVQVKLWDSLRTRAIPERLRAVITTRRYTNPHLPSKVPAARFENMWQLRRFYNSYSAVWWESSLVYWQADKTGERSSRPEWCTWCLDTAQRSTSNA